MSSPIVVTYGPETSDRGSVEFAVAAARFTGAPLAASPCTPAVRSWTA